MEIYYSGYSKNYDSPGDRRRFLYYAKNNKIKFEFYKKDIKTGIVITNPFSPDLKQLVYLAKNNKIKLILEAIDSFFIESIFYPYHILKSIKELRFNYHLIVEAFKNSSKIVVSNDIQKNYLLNQGYKNIYVIPDYSNEYNNNFLLKDLSYKKKLNLGWEGMGINIRAIEQITKYSIEETNNLTVITDKNALKYLSKTIKNFQYFEWDKLKHVENIKAADVMLIPVLTNSIVHMAKPATRIRHYFNMGKIVLAYPNSANQLEMNKANLGDFCAPINLWPKLLDLLKEPEIRRNYISRVLEYKKIFLNEKSIHYKWHNLLSN